MFDERDEQDFLDFDDDGESDLGERWSALQIFQEREEENAWRDTCEDGSEYGLDPEDHETEEEYEEALEEEKHGWRETCEDGSEFGLDPEDYETEEEYEWCIEQTILKDGQPWDANMVLDDGGDLTEILHKKYPQMLERIHGITEETTTGVHRLLDMLKNGTLKVPAINVNDSVTKSKNDNKYGCRHSLNDAIKRGTDHLLSGKQALVIGYGDVGKGSSQSLRQEGMIVKVAEVDPICAMQACMDGFEVVSPYKNGINDGTEASIDAALLGKIDLIVTTTGNVNVCDANMLKALKKRAVVCNIGHFDNEIDTAFMRKNWAWEEVKPQVHKIHRTGKDGFDAHNDDYLILLAEGRLVNLGNATGHPSRIMDGSFANQVLAQIHLFEQKYADLPAAEKAKRLSVEVLPKKLDEEVALEMVKGFGGVVTQLTPKQAEYIGVSVEGPFKPDTYRY